MKILVVVAGGICQCVYATPELTAVECEVIDHDNLESEGKSREEADRFEAEEASGLVAVY